MTTAWTGTRCGAGIASILVMTALFVGACVRAEPGLILHQTHRFSERPGVDTTRTYITAKFVRVSHAKGDAILDLSGERLVLLDDETHTWRSMPLREWENAILEAAVGSEADTTETTRRLAFEPAGNSVQVAGYVCDRWVLYTRRELLPGEVDWVEQQIWVSNELQMPPGAYEAYDRAMRAIDSIGLGGVADRPVGVLLRTEIRVRVGGESGGGDVEYETTNVFEVEKMDLPDTWFAIPDHYTRAAEN